MVDAPTQLPDITVRPEGANAALRFDDIPDQPAPSKGLPSFNDMPDESQQPKSLLQSATAGFTDIPSAYSQIVKENVERMSRGTGQIESGQPWEMTKGVGNLVLGGLGYTTAPINAPLHTIVGNPVHEATGSELLGNLAEAGAGFMLPIPKGLPRGTAALPEEAPFGVTLSAGERANDMAMRQNEQRAIRNADEHALAWKAQREAQIGQANAKIAESFDPFGMTLAETPQEAGQLVSQGVQSAAASAKTAVQQAYEQARALPGQIHAGVFEGIGQGIKGDLSLGDAPVIIDQGTTPNAAKMIDYLDKQITNLKIQNKADPFGAPNPETITGVSLNGIDQWRKNLSAMRSDAFGASPPGKTSGDARAAQAVLNAFDERIDQAINSGQFTGDHSAIAAWNNARAANTDYRSTFGVRKGDAASRVVQKIIGDNVNDPMTPGKVMDQLVGASRTAPSSLNIAVANRLKGILGERSPEWIAAKQGLFRSLVEPGEGEAAFDTGKVAQRLSKFLNGDLAPVVYTPEELGTLRAYANLNRQIAMAAGNYFPSAPAIQQAMAAVRSRIGAVVGAIIGRAIVPIPLVGELMGLTAGAQTERALERLHSGVSKQLPLVADQMAAWNRAQSAAIAQPGNPLLRRAAVGATVNLQKTLTPLGIDLKQLAAGPQAPGTAYGGSDQQSVPGPPPQ